MATPILPHRQGRILRGNRTKYLGSKAIPVRPTFTTIYLKEKNIDRNDVIVITDIIDMKVKIISNVMV